MRQLKTTLAALALLLLIAACKGESPTAPNPGSGGGPGGPGPGTPPPAGVNLVLTASTAEPLVDSTVTITATATIDGQPVPNGTAVEFESTGGGLENTSATALLRTTTNGVATVRLTSSVAGPITVRAIVNNVSRSVSVTFKTTPVIDPPPNTSPTITGITPAIGRPAGGETIRITGTNFRGPVRVLFDTGAALPVEGFVVASTETTIDVITPGVNLGAGQQLVTDIIILTGAGTATEQRAERADAFTFRNEQLTPVISTATPNSGPVVGGTRVTIFGSGFQAPVQVLFGAAEARVITVDFSQIIVEAPMARDTSENGSGTVTGPVGITVRNINSQTSVSLPGGFRYTAALQITAVGPGSGPSTGGTRVTIDGVGFVAPVSVVVRTGEGDVVLQPIDVSATRIVAITPAVEITDCEDLIGPIIVTNIVNGDQAEGPPFRFDVAEPFILGVDGANPIVPGSTISVRVLNAGTFPQLRLGTNGAPISGRTDAGNVTTFTATVPTTIPLQQTTCPNGGTRLVETAFDVTYTSAESGCTVTIDDGLTVQPPQTARLFVTPNPLQITATAATAEDPEQDGSAVFAVVNTSSLPVTVGGAASSNPNFSIGAFTPLVLAPCDQAIIAVTYEAGAAGSTETATIRVDASSSQGALTVFETVIGRTQ